MPRSAVLALLGTHAVAVIGLAVFVAWKHERWPRLAKADRVKVGMTRAEVHEVMGGPPGSYYHPETWPSPRGFDGLMCNEECWIFTTGVLRVGFSDDGIAEEVRVEDVRRHFFPTRWDRLLGRVNNDPFAWVVDAPWVSHSGR
jgi:hypothetical protein